MAFTIRQLQYFVAVAETGTVSGAAKSLSISQSAVTEALKDLEADLGVSLFQRHSRGLHITHKGHQFLRHATGMLTSVANARRAFDEEAVEEVGTLHLGVTSLVAGYVMSDILARFRRAHPKVEVTAIEDDGSYLEHLLIGGELDVAVMLATNLRNRFALQAENLASSPYKLWLPMGHPLSTKERVAPSDLSSEPLIMLSIDEIEEPTERLLESLGARPKIAFKTKSVEAVRSLVATGAGIAILPDLIYRPWSLDGDRIDQRDVSASLPVIQVGIVWRMGSSISRAAKNFIATAQSTSPS